MPTSLASYQYQSFIFLVYWQLTDSPSTDSLSKCNTIKRWLGQFWLQIPMSSQSFSTCIAWYYLEISLNRRESITWESFKTVIKLLSSCPKPNHIVSNLNSCSRLNDHFPIPKAENLLVNSFIFGGNMHILSWTMLLSHIGLSQ